jgi:hypothetical protein
MIQEKSSDTNLLAELFFKASWRRYIKPIFRPDGGLIKIEYATSYQYYAPTEY